MKISKGKFDDISYISTIFFSCSFPHSSTQSMFSSRNGENYLHISGENIPYGAKLRLLFMFITREVVIKRTKIIKFNNYYALTRELLLAYGKNSLSSVKEQIKRLKDCTIEIFINKKLIKVEIIVSEDQIVIDNNLYHFILEHSVPVSINIVKKIKSSSLAMDLYFFMTHRSRYNKKLCKISIPSLAIQFASKYKNLKCFKFKLKKEIDKIIKLYPNPIKIEQDFIVFFPVNSSIKSSN